MTKLLLVDDDVEFCTLLADYLAGEQFDVSVAHDGLAAIERLRDAPVDLTILDVMMPVMNGLDVLRELRSFSTAPVLMLTARGEEDHKVQGLAAGADDYLTKPFSTRELASRIKAVLRRSNVLHQESAIEAEGLKLDPVSHRVSADDKLVEMGPTEYRLLAFFMSHPERAYTRTQMLDQVWGGNVYVEDRTIDVHIRRLRKALEPFGYDRFIQTVRGTGYRFSVQTNDKVEPV